MKLHDKHIFTAITCGVILAALVSMLNQRTESADLVIRRGTGSGGSDDTKIPTNGVNTTQFFWNGVLNITNTAIVTNLQSRGTAGAASSTTLGQSTTASANDTVAIGSSSVASALDATALGAAATADAQNATAIGSSSYAAYSGSTAIGVATTTTAANQVRLGTSSDHVSVPGLLSVEANAIVPLLAAPATNVVDMTIASATNILNAAVTVLHATNGVTASERTHVRWFWAGGADRALVIPTAWKTNVYSAVPANITNGTITKMYVTSIGDTSSSANQSNVFVSFEYYK